MVDDVFVRWRVTLTTCPTRSCLSWAWIALRDSKRVHRMKGIPLLPIVYGKRKKDLQQKIDHYTGVFPSKNACRDQHLVRFLSLFLVKVALCADVLCTDKKLAVHLRSLTCSNLRRFLHVWELERSTGVLLIDPSSLGKWLSLAIDQTLSLNLCRTSRYIEQERLITSSSHSWQIR